jgi:hypothetical protein
MTFSELWNGGLNVELASEQTTLFTAALRKKAVNDAMQTFVRQTGCTVAYGEMSIQESEEEADLFAFLTDFIRLAGDPSIRIVTELTAATRYIQGREAFPRRNPEQLDWLESGWRAAPDSTPSFWYLRKHLGRLYLGMHPPPAVKEGEIWDWLVPYVAKPTVMVADADVPFTISGESVLDLEQWHQALVHYAAAQLEPLRKNYSGVTRQMAMYTSYVAQYLQQERASGQDQITLVQPYYGANRSRARDPRSWP